MYLPDLIKEELENLLFKATNTRNEKLVEIDKLNLRHKEAK